MEIPSDISAYAAASFPKAELEKVVSLLGSARASDGTEPNARLLRCALFSSQGDLESLREMLALLAVDDRDVIVCGEYELQDKEYVQVRDFNSPFGERSN